ncbi:MAG: hypothetical protein LBO78_01350 [Rickettsiales bacterium]|nr:hypothetical protein [Rickettsiales bacterium]
MRKILFTLLLLSSFAARAQTTGFRFSAPPSMAGLNIVFSRGYYGRAGGAIHNLAARIFEGTEAKPVYADKESDSYNLAVQTAMLGSASMYSGTDFVAGAAFDEDNLAFLDYIPAPIYEDFLAIVADKKGVPPDFKPTKEIDSTIMSLMPSLRPAGIAGMNLGISDKTFARKFDKMSEAMEAAFAGRYFVIAPWSMVAGYLETNGGNPKASSLLVMKFQKRRIYYFIAVGKASADKPVPGAGMGLARFVEKRLLELRDSGELARITGQK